MNKTISAMMLAAMMVPAMAMAQPGHDDHRGDDRNAPGMRGDDHRGPGMGGQGMGGQGMRGDDHRGPGMGGMGMRGDDHRGPGGYYRFNRGERFDRARAMNYGNVDYRRYRGLRAPPRGYHWVRNGNDAVLVGITSGIVASVIAGAIR